MYEKLMLEYDKKVEIYEVDMNIKGLYADGIIAISKRLGSSIEKVCILAEELGHYHTSAGDILDQSKIENRKQEKRARNWAYEKLVPLARIVQAYKSGVSNRYEMAEFLEVTEEFLDAAIHRYKEKYGLFAPLDNYIVYFDPLTVVEKL